MADALLCLMQEKSLDKITFQEIAATAGVGRSSWFRNFTSKEEALSFKLLQLWKRWAAGHGLADCQRYTLASAAAFFEFNYSIRDTLKIIYDAQCSSCVYDAFYAATRPQHAAGMAELYEIRFYTLGLYGLLSEWVSHNFEATPEEMTRILYQIMHQPEPSSASYLEKRD